jgi:hypoxanthine phosphoribosyltransferase
METDRIFIPDNQTVPSSLLYVPTKYQKYIDDILINYGLIQDRIAKLAENITKIYDGSSLTILVILKGAFKFAKDLTDEIDKVKSSLEYNLEFIRVKSYENESQNEIQVQGLDKINIEGKNVLIVEDLVDSGNSLNKLKTLITEKQPASFRIAVLLYKRTLANTLIMPDIIGFSIPDRWIVGYNMDYNEKFRDLQHIAILNDLGKEDLRLFD